MLGLEGYKAQTFGANYANERQNAQGANRMIDEWFGAGANRMGNSASDFKKALADALANSGGPAQERLAALLKHLKANISEDEDNPASRRRRRGKEEEEGYNVNFTALEKMGFVMSGIGNADFAQRTANATEQIARKMDDLIESMSDSDEPVHEMG